MDHDNEGEKMEKRFSLLLQMTSYCLLFLNSYCLLFHKSLFIIQIFSSVAFLKVIFCYDINRAVL